MCCHPVIDTIDLTIDSDGEEVVHFRPAFWRNSLTDDIISISSESDNEGDLMRQPQSPPMSENIDWSWNSDDGADEDVLIRITIPAFGGSESYVEEINVNFSTHAMVADWIDQQPFQYQDTDYYHQHMNFDDNTVDFFPVNGLQARPLLMNDIDWNLNTDDNSYADLINVDLIGNGMIQQPFEHQDVGFYDQYMNFDNDNIVDDSLELAEYLNASDTVFDIVDETFASSDFPEYIIPDGELDS